MTRKIQILYRENIVASNSKLRSVKAIKDLTGLGLKDSKYLCDDLYDSPNIPKLIECRVIETLDIKKILSDFPPEIKVSFIEEERNIKLLSLGMGELEDYQESLEYYLGFETKSPIIKEIISILTKEQMIHLSGIITKEYYG